MQTCIHFWEYTKKKLKKTPFHWEIGCGHLVVMVILTSEPHFLRILYLCFSVYEKQMWVCGYRHVIAYMWRSETTFGCQLSPSTWDRFPQCCGNQVGWSWSTMRFSCHHHLYSPVRTLKLQTCGTAWRVCVFCFNVLMIRTQVVRLAGQMLSLTKPSTQLLICLVHSCRVNQFPEQPDGSTGRANC